MLYIVLSFVKLSRTVSKLYSGHDFYTEITNGNNSAKTGGGATVVNLCMLSGHALYLCQVSRNNLERYQSYRVDTIPMGKMTKGNNSTKNAGEATVVNLCTSSSCFIYQLL